MLVLTDGVGMVVVSGSNLRNVTEDDLSQTDMPALGGKVKGLCLDTGRVHRVPFQVLLFELCVWRVLGLDGDRLDGIRAVLWLGSAGDIGESICRVECQLGIQ